MELTVMVTLGLALAAVAAAIFGFNALAGKGPRGTVWLLAASLFTWGTLLPIAFQDADGSGMFADLELLVTVLQLCGLIGLLLGIFDAFGPRRADTRHPIAEAVVRQPLVWATLACANFYALLYQGTIDSPLLWRYCARHPVEIIEVAFFFVGLAILAIRFGDVSGQLRSLRAATLGPVPTGGQTPADCDHLLSRLDNLPQHLQDTYLARRLRAAVEFVRRKGSADELDDQLRHLEEIDAGRVHAGYATLRIIIWAIPILGFLGTVIGITVAIANLSPDALEQSMTEVTQGLGVAFDTTAEALALTMVLMFAKSLVERLDDRLLSAVNARTSEELVGRFQASAADDADVASVRRMSEQVLAAVETLAARQADVWKTTIDATHQQWADVSVATGKIIEDSLSASIKENCEMHGRVLANSALQHADRVNRGAHEVVGRLREGLEKLAELLIEALQRHGDVVTSTERELAEGNRRSLAEVEAALEKAISDISLKRAA